jgi:hypothetical protein
VSGPVISESFCVLIKLLVARYDGPASNNNLKADLLGFEEIIHGFRLRRFIS